MFKIFSVLLSLMALVWSIAEAPCRSTGEARGSQRLADTSAEEGKLEGTGFGHGPEPGDPVFMDQRFAQSALALPPPAHPSDGATAHMNGWLETLIDPNGDSEVVLLASLSGRAGRMSGAA